MYVEIPQSAREEIERVSRRYGFTKVNFYPYYEGSGDSRSRTQARTPNPETIIFYYNFLDSALRLYEIDAELLRKVTEVVCLHERKHYDFPDPPNADDQEVQKRAAEAYGNRKEFCILDILLFVFTYTEWMSEEELRKTVSKYLDENLGWLKPEEREEIVNIMSNKRFYRKKHLKRMLITKEYQPKSFLERIKDFYRSRIALLKPHA